MSRLGRILTAALVFVGAVMLPAAVLASGLEEPTPVGPDAVQVDGAFALPPYVVSVILGVVIPLVTGLLTKLLWASWVKQLVTIVLSGVAGLVNVHLVDGGGAVISWSAFISAAITWAFAMVAYLGWSTVGLTSSFVTRTDSTGTLVTEPGKLANVGIK